MKNLISTSSDSNCGDFLINHWFKSLKDNVNLENIDVVVIDYGLTKKQIQQLKERGIIVYKCVRDGFPNAIKFRDINKFISERIYDQILTCDCGDIIFQEDISPLFEKDKTVLRAVCEDINPPFDKVFIKRHFSKEDIKKIKKIRDKKMINMGVLLGPYNLFKKFGEEYTRLLKIKGFGADQIAVNYLFYKIGFKEINSKYNFVITTAAQKFLIKEGTFYLTNEEKIPIVHNAGGNKVFRTIRNFGYGKNYNKFKKITYHLLRNSIKIINLLEIYF
jgi:hypothetical protein